MDFRRSGQLDERRRRVLMDEIASPPTDSDNPDANPAIGGSAKGPVRAYCPAVLEERQPRVTDLVPIRGPRAAAVILLGLTAIAAIETIYIHLATLPLGAAARQLAALDVSQRGSLAAGYSALLLALATAGALVVFGIRSHRVDDYRGRYRVWLWVAAALGWASLDAGTGIRDSLGLGIAMIAGQQLNGESAVAAATISWLVVYGLVLGTLALRLAMEVWASLPSFTALATAGLCYLIVGLMQLDMFAAASPLVNAVIESSLAMTAHLALAAAVLLYARHVHLDAQGRLKVHIDPDKKKPKKAKSRTKLKVVKEESSGDEPPAKPAAKPAIAAETPKAATQPRFGFGGSSSAAPAAKASATISNSKPAASSSADYDDDADDDEDDSAEGQKLSRAERKRLKKLARREQGQQGQRRAA